MKKKIGIYIHIPFCRRVCYYCHFVKFKWQSGVVDRYIGALVREIELRASTAVRVDSVYLGGGSPSLLSDKQVFSILDAVNRHFTVDPRPEVTLEANPEDVTAGQLDRLGRVGVNRLSLGVQSFLPEDLHYLQRQHGPLEAVKAVENALGAGFSNLNVDFIIGLPTQTGSTLERNLSRLDRLDVPHVSAYILEGEGQKKNGAKGEKRDHDLYFLTREFLLSRGYRHYEVSNFARRGFLSQHNLKYWKNRDYLGIGVSASGYENKRDYRNAANLEDYFEFIRKSRLPVEEYTFTDPATRKIVMGLRLMRGISVKNFKHHRDELDLLVSGGFLVRNKERISVPPGRILLLNEILTYFM